MALEAYQDLLDAPMTAILASNLPDGSVQASPVWFLSRDGELLISTTTDRQKYRNLRRDPRMAFTVIDPSRALRYLEIRGTAHITDDTDLSVRDAIAHKHGYQDGSTFDHPDAHRVIVAIVPTRIIER